ncbi:MAG: hypothetical protein Q9166_004434 [cf. Caloplaca sp. 2 TL-2023]
MAEVFIKYGANINIAPAFTVSYLRNVAVFGDEQMLRPFIGAKLAIDVSLRDPQGCTAQDRRKEWLSMMELVDVCTEEYEKAQGPPEYDIIEELLDKKDEGYEEDEEEIDEIFHDALENQDASEDPRVPAPAPTPSHGVQTTDWALKMSPTIGSRDSEQSIQNMDWAMKRRPTASYQDSGQKIPSR